MSNKKQSVSKRTKASNKAKRYIVIIAGAALVITAVALAARGGIKGYDTASAGGGLVIPKGEITETAKFYPYKAGGTEMEVIAVKAGDGTIRTAFNTCQVCFDSGKGYYKQQGDVLVCQNCGNSFNADQVEKIKGGCNPVPIAEENKKDDGANITISGDFLAQNKKLFSNWSK